MRFVAAIIVSLLSITAPLASSALARPNATAGKVAATPSTKQPEAKVPPSGAKGAPASKPKDVWSATEIAAAQKVCKAILRKYHAIATPMAPIKKGRCGDSAPVRLIQIGQRPVSFSPPPTVNCRMVAALGKWISTGLQPLAKKHLGSRLKQISVMSSYSCRNRYGRAKAKLSEHAKANALDIGGFVFDDAVNLRVLASWGATRRDLVARAEAAKKMREALAQPAPDPKGSRPDHKPQTAKAADARAPKRGGGDTGPETQGFRSVQRSAVGRGPGPVFAERFRQVILPPLPERRPSLKERMRWAQLERRAALRRATQERRRLESYRAKLNRFLNPPAHLGGPKKAAAASAGNNAAATAGSEADRTRFLKAAHRSACRFFGTVLGPEANEAHRNHFHVDLAKRKRSNYCQ